MMDYVVKKVTTVYGSMRMMCQMLHDLWPVSSYPE